MSLSDRRSRSSRRSGKRPSVNLDMTPMVDVVFLLIIFFMVSTNFISLESGLPIDLPQAQSASVNVSQLPTVSVNKNRDISFDGVAVANPQELLTLVQEKLLSQGNTVVVLRADKDVPHGTTVQIMDILKQAGAARIAIATGGQ
ncbi:MAG: biopolymer transporter ExbD [Deinococcales bacterium]